MNMYVTFLLNTCFKMEEESLVVLKEISAANYTPTLYFWSKSLADFLFFVPALLVQSFVYPIFLHMRTDFPMFLHVFELVMWVALIANSFGLLLGCLVSGGAKTIVQYIPIFFVPFIVLSGFILNTGTLGIFSFLKYTSPLKYLLEMILRYEFEGSPNGQAKIQQFNYTIGMENCRIVVACFVVVARILAYAAFLYRSSTFL